MAQTASVNRRILLRSRPTGAPVASNFQLDQADVPDLQAGQVLLRTLWLSLDPYMRGRMSDAPSYAPPMALGDVMVGGTVSRVERSRRDDLHVGDLVAASAGWQDYAVSDGTVVRRLAADDRRPSLALGVLGMPGFTAYMGLLDIGRPRTGDTVVVAAASGAVGSVVGQVAAILGCRVVGIAGGARKCAYVVDDLQFDTCLDHRAPDLPGRLAAACPRGIDVYFENVGGAVFRAVMPLLNPHARVPVCGLASQYNDTGPSSDAASSADLMSLMLRQRLSMRGFIVFDDYAPRFGEFLAAMQPWVADGRVRVAEDIVPGLEDAPNALIGLLDGKNFGKVVVRVGGD